jgi:serine protease Do
MKLVARFTLIFLSLVPIAVRGEGTPVPAVIQEDVELSATQRALIRDSCYEVVVPRMDGDALTYEKPLPWELVPYKIRNDHYISIGTAFAITRNELVTAFHVLGLESENLAFQHFYIRDQDGKVWEIDKILACHEHKDVVRFTVKEKTFEKWLELDPEYQINSSVYTVGNACGEGVVIRRGELIGTLPEEMDGAFQWLKSSANVNPGNSGGPLVNGAGKVIGVVLRKKDNLCYSLPIKEMLDLKKDTAAFYTRIFYGFNLLPGKTRPVVDRFDLTLPINRASLAHEASQRRLQSYHREMAALLAENGDPYKVDNAASFEVIHSLPTSTFLQYFYLDKNTDKWTNSDLKPKSYDLEQDGLLQVANGGDISYLRLRKPTGISWKDLLAKPKIAMDLTYQGLHLTRSMGGQEIRITSLGAPFRSSAYADQFNRPWTVSAWLLDFADKIILLATTPVPGGLAGVIKETTADNLEPWTYDLEKVLDHVYVPYTGKLKEWKEFLGLSQALPQAFRSVRMEYRPDDHFSLKGFWLSLDLDSAQQAIKDDSIMYLQMGFDRQNGQVIWGLRRFYLDEDDNNNYFVLNKRLKPMKGMNEDYLKAWMEMVREEHPYTKESYFENGSTRISMVHPAFRMDHGDAEQAPALFTFTIGRSGNTTEERMKELLDHLSTAMKPAASE